MNAATTGFFQKCQQYFSRGNTNSNTSSQNYEVETSDNEDQESFTSKLSNFGRAYQKVSTEDNTTK